MTKDRLTMANIQRNQSMLRSGHGSRRSRVDDINQEQLWEYSMTQKLPNYQYIGSSESELWQPHLPNTNRKSAQYYQRNFSRKNNTRQEAIDAVSYYRAMNNEQCHNLLNLPSSNMVVASHFNLQAAAMPARMTRSCNESAQYFAGSKCGDAPPPSFVPRPPQHWISNRDFAIQDPRSFSLYLHEQRCIGLTSELKGLLHVQ